MKRSFVKQEPGLIRFDQVLESGSCGRAVVEGAPSELVAVVEAIAVFLGPVAEALHEGRGFEGRWEAPGPWSNA